MVHIDQQIFYIIETSIFILNIYNNLFFISKMTSILSFMIFKANFSFTCPPVFILELNLCIEGFIPPLFAPCNIIRQITSNLL